MSSFSYVVAASAAIAKTLLTKLEKKIHTTIISRDK